MIDVARLAGVSHQTVSRVLNDSPNVGPEVLERVQHAIRLLGYTRNTAARALASRRSMSLGAVTYGVAQYGPSLALHAIAEASSRVGYATSLVTLREIDRESVRAAIDQLIAFSVDGIVLVAPVTAAISAVHGMTTDVPLVTFECGPVNSVTSQSVDELLGARLATRHLLDLGHETVLHVSGPDGWLGTEVRIRGWRTEVDAAGRVAPPVITGDWSAASGYRAGQQIANDRRITAVFAANDQMALGVLQALQQAGISVPTEVSVVGFDDTPECAFYQPALTTVRLDFAEVGRRCVGRLLDIIRGISLTPDPPLQPQMVVRSSTSVPPQMRTHPAPLAGYSKRHPSSATTQPTVQKEKRP